MTTSYSASTTRRQRWRVGVRGWWGNKPPPQRILVGLGLVVTGLLLTGGFLCLEHSGTSAVRAELSKLLLDVGKGSLLGTLALAVISDITVWGSSWKMLRAMSSEICRTADALTASTTSQLVGFGHYSGLTFYLHWSLERAQKVSKTYLELSERLKVVSTWDELISGYPPYKHYDQVLKSFVEDDAQVEAYVGSITAAVEELRAVILDARKATSPALSGSITDLARELLSLPNNCSLLCAFLREIAEGQVTESAAREAGLNATLVALRFSGLASVLSLIEFEANNGVPYGYRLNVDQ
jgi:hypothetical protein